MLNEDWKLCIVNFCELPVSFIIEDVFHSDKMGIKGA